MSTRAPVLLIIFNRFDTASQVLQRILEAGVSRIYIYCDGPRNPPEQLVLAEVQQKLLQMIPPDRQVTTWFYGQNKGPRVAVGEAISSFFEAESEGIVLEHDCLPHPSFFGFCDRLLEYYRNDDAVMHISGDNFQFGRQYGDGSYYFSNMNHIWGFATWRRAWKYYDNSFSKYPEFKQKNIISKIFPDRRCQAFWTQHLDLVAAGKIVTWDAQWSIDIWMRGGLSIIPQVNLVSNIGFGGLSLNTHDESHRMANIPSKDIGIIQHPSSKNICYEADRFSIYDTFHPTLFTLAKRKLKKLLK